jgi:hypothetical protein
MYPAFLAMSDQIRTSEAAAPDQVGHLCCHIGATPLATGGAAHEPMSLETQGTKATKPLVELFQFVHASTPPRPVHSFVIIEGKALSGPFVVVLIIDEAIAWVVISANTNLRAARHEIPTASTWAP